MMKKISIFLFAAAALLGAGCDDSSDTDKVIPVSAIFSTVRVNWADWPSTEIVIVASPTAIADTMPSSVTDAIIGFDEL